MEKLECELFPKDKAFKKYHQMTKEIFSECTEVHLEEDEDKEYSLKSDDETGCNIF